MASSLASRWQAQINANNSSSPNEANKSLAKPANPAFAKFNQVSNNSNSANTSTANGTGNKPNYGASSSGPPKFGGSSTNNNSGSNSGTGSIANKPASTNQTNKTPPPIYQSTSNTTTPNSFNKPSVNLNLSAGNKSSISSSSNTNNTGSDRPVSLAAARNATTATSPRSFGSQNATTNSSFSMSGPANTARVTMNATSPTPSFSSTTNSAPSANKNPVVPPSIIKPPVSHRESTNLATSPLPAKTLPPPIANNPLPINTSSSNPISPPPARGGPLANPQLMMSNIFQAGIYKPKPTEPAATSSNNNTPPSITSATSPPPQEQAITSPPLQNGNLSRDSVFLLGDLPSPPQPPASNNQFVSGNPLPPPPNSFLNSGGPNFSSGNFVAPPTNNNFSSSASPPPTNNNFNSTASSTFGMPGKPLPRLNSPPAVTPPEDSNYSPATSPTNKYNNNNKGSMNPSTGSSLFVQPIAGSKSSSSNSRNASGATTPTTSGSLNESFITTNPLLSAVQQGAPGSNFIDASNSANSINDLYNSSSHPAPMNNNYTASSPSVTSSSSPPNRSPPPLPLSSIPSIAPLSPPSTFSPTASKRVSMIPSRLSSTGGLNNDEDDEEGFNNSTVPDGFQEFIDQEGNRIFFNPATGAVQKGNPIIISQPNSDRESDDEEGYDNFQSNMGDRYRNNSLVLREAWDNSNPNASPNSTVNARSIPPALRQSIATGVFQAGPDLPLPGAMRASMAIEGHAKKALTAQSLSNTLMIIEKQISNILGEPNLSDIAGGIVDDLKAITTRLNSAIQTLESKTGVAADTRNDVEALTDIGKLEWNFNNSVVDQFRAEAVRFPHSEFEFRDWHLPHYFSTLPLPPGVKSYTGIIKLPVSDNAPITSTRINITETETVKNAIRSSLAKIKLEQQSEDYVLKGQGVRDYMYGEHLLMEYEYVRSAIREGAELKLQLVRKPTPLNPPANQPDFPSLYRNKVNPNLQVVTSESFRGCSINQAWYNMGGMLLSEVNQPFRFKVLGMENVDETSLPRSIKVVSIHVRVVLFHGIQYLNELKEAETVPHELGNAPRWNQTFLFKDLLLSNLPRATRLALLICGRKATGKEVILAHAVHNLIDEQGYMQEGRKELKLWALNLRVKGKHGKPRDVEPDFFTRQCPRDNHTVNAQLKVASLFVEYSSFPVPVVAPLVEKYREPNLRAVGSEVPLKSLSDVQMKQFTFITGSDPLYNLSNDDKSLLWTMRHSLIKFPPLLPKFLQSVNWGHIDHRMEAYRLLNVWAQPNDPVMCLELLDAKYADCTIREYAINILRRLSDEQIKCYLLQMTQCLKFESYHNSPLSRFLIERSLKSPFIVGHHFFWHLKAELHNSQVCERYACILEEYLSHAGRETIELRKQLNCVLRLQRVSEMVQRLKRELHYPDADCMAEYTKELEKLNEEFFKPMGKFQIPLNPKQEATTLIVDKCRYMSSKMVPLWLVFRNSDEEAGPIYIIFKSGDDLRQDILTLQMLSLMDKLWLSAGLDMKMKPYRVIATGVNDNKDGVGLIEVVMNSATTSGIHIDYGGGATGALKTDTIDLFLKDHNKGNHLYLKAQENFVSSCAGYW
jgi:hypothetical protein